MKRNDWILLITVLIYSALFYKQSAGINFVIFTMAVIAALLVKDKQLASKRNWIMAAAGSFLSAICIAIHGNTLGLVANIISLSLLSGMSLNPNSSVVLALFFSAYSYLTSPIYMIIDYVEKKKDTAATAVKSSRKFVLFIIPIVFTIAFFFIYRSSSTLFDALASKINWDFISWGWILFTLGGLILLYGFFYHKRIDEMAVLDDKFEKNVTDKSGRLTKLFGKEITMADENFSGTLLFVMLNLLLLIVNVLDFDFIFGGQHLPLGVTPKEFLHQGTNMLIVSIVVAIAIILYYFRGNLNFYQKNKTIKTLACIWVAQNAFMVFSTACRNNLYITEYGLTYKRIGVYIYLALTLIGLVTTLSKVINARSNMYLFRKNGWAFYSLLIVLSFPNWDRLICNFNMSHIETVDTGYLLSLSDNTLADLLPAYSNGLPGADVQPSLFVHNYCHRISEAVLNDQVRDIRSWNYDDTRVYSEITSPEFINKITLLDLSGDKYTPGALDSLKLFTHVTDLRMNMSNIKSLKPLAGFTLVKRLNMAATDITDLNGIENFSGLESIDLRYCHIYDYSPLYKLANLKELYVSNISDNMYTQIMNNKPGLNIRRS